MQGSLPSEAHNGWCDLFCLSLDSAGFWSEAHKSYWVLVMRLSESHDRSQPPSSVHFLLPLRTLVKPDIAQGEVGGGERRHHMVDEPWVVLVDQPVHQ